MRKRSKISAGLAAVVVPLTAIVALGATPAGAAVGGSGPYPADYETSTGLPNHTVYRPQTLPAERLPVFVWGNGGCAANGTAQVNFLREISSHGFLAIASGAPNGSGSTTSQMLTQSIDWAVAENSRQGSKYYGRLDTTKIAVAGWSCGGLEAYAVSDDPRVTTTGIFSSGLLNDADDYQLRRLTNIAARAGVSMLADHYDEDWARLWWVRADGDAAIVTGRAAMAGPLRLLAARYPQYQADPPAGPVIAITVHHWTGWTAAP